MSVRLEVSAPRVAALPTIERRKRWTTAEFDRLLAEGFLEEGGPGYLWDGAIIEAMSEYPPHVNAIENLYRLLIQRFPSDSWTVNQGRPVELEDGYKPQPDFSVLKGPRALYRAHVPTPIDVSLVIEVSNTSYPKDFGPFVRKYAEKGIPAYWIVNIARRRIEVYEGLNGPEVGTTAYTIRTIYDLDNELPLVIPRDGVAHTFNPIRVRDVLCDSLEPYEERKTT